ncbi:MAG: hypothetical protein RBS56_02475 [Candidatus Gracilibacteria bacterium]|jgi:hypothetical protein|nr:hypothetical protein [Candidatus Gracilibacteria bacterium]
MNDFLKNFRNNRFIIKLIVFLVLLFLVAFLWLFFAKDSATKVVSTNDNNMETQIVQIKPYEFFAEVLPGQVSDNLNLSGVSEISALNFSVKNVSQESLVLNSLKFEVDASGLCEKITGCVKDIVLENGEISYKGGFSSSNFVVFQNLKLEVPALSTRDFSVRVMFSKDLSETSTKFSLGMKKSDISVINAQGMEMEVKGDLSGAEFVAN